MIKSKFLRVCSDLHFEFYPDLSSAISLLIPRDPRDEESTLILAGDIHSNRIGLKNLFSSIRSRFKEIIFVPGNHEYYGNNIQTWKQFGEDLEDEFDIYVTNQEVHQSFLLGGFEVIATTLWADASGEGSFSAHYISKWPDFRHIQNGDRSFSVKDMIELNKKQSKFIHDSVQTSPYPTIVITHHLPSYHLCDKRYSPSPGDGLFASNQDDLFVGEKPPVLWICGHTHTHIDRVLGSTWVIANPSGYPNESGVLYEPKLFIDLEKMELDNASLS